MRRRYTKLFNECARISTDPTPGVAPKMAEIVPDLAKLRPDSVISGPISSGQFCSIRGNIRASWGKCRSSLGRGWTIPGKVWWNLVATFGRFRTNVGRFRAKFGGNWPVGGQIWSIPGLRRWKLAGNRSKFRAKLADVGRSLPKAGQCWPEFDFGWCRPQFGRNRPGVGQIGRRRPKSTRTLGKIGMASINLHGPCWRMHQVRPRLGRVQPDLGRYQPKVSTRNADQRSYTPRCTHPIKPIHIGAPACGAREDVRAKGRKHWHISDASAAHLLLKLFVQTLRQSNASSNARHQIARMLQTTQLVSLDLREQELSTGFRGPHARLPAPADHA